MVIIFTAEETSIVSGICQIKICGFLFGFNKLFVGFLFCIAGVSYWTKNRFLLEKFLVSKLTKLKQVRRHYIFLVTIQLSLSKIRKKNNIVVWDIIESVLTACYLDYYTWILIDLFYSLPLNKKLHSLATHEKKNPPFIQTISSVKQC